MAVDLGRAQGASIFHTMAASGTSVAVSSLQPQNLTPFVGDAVQFPNGDVRQITAVSGSMITLGAVLFSYKGDPGIGNAVLSNIDGNSTENGFTQAAVKGVAQSGNYYNLGAFDTYVSNGDGTGTVTRKTKCLTVNDVTFGVSYDYYIYIIPKSPINIAGIYNVRWNISKTASTTNYDEDRGIFYYTDLNGFVYKAVSPYEKRTVKEWGTYFKEKNMLIQYELAPEYQYEERVIENQPIHIANQEECLYWHDEWGKGLNLITGIVEGYGLTDDGSIVVSPTLYVTNYIEVQSNQTYTQSGLSDDWVLFYDSEKSKTGSANARTFVTPNNCAYVRLNSLINGYDKPMLVKGSHPYPYEPYHGSIVREKDLSGIQLFPENVNPAQTIGGDWEDLGTVTVGSTTLHAYQKVKGGN